MEIFIEIDNKNLFKVKPKNEYHHSFEPTSNFSAHISGKSCVNSAITLLQNLVFIPYETDDENFGKDQLNAINRSLEIMEDALKRGSYAPIKIKGKGTELNGLPSHVSLSLTVVEMPKSHTIAIRDYDKLNIHKCLEIFDRIGPRKEEIKNRTLLTGLNAAEKFVSLPQASSSEYDQIIADVTRVTNNVAKTSNDDVEINFAKLVFNIMTGDINEVHRLIGVLREIMPV